MRRVRDSHAGQGPRAKAHIARNGGGANGEVIRLDSAALLDPKRASRVMTETDALGRPRVPRRRAAKSA